MTEARVAWAAGKGDRTLVLLHGYPLDGRMWAHQRADLPRFAKTVCVDLPGFGSAAGEAAPETMEGFAEAVRTVLESPRRTPATVLGHSFGGYVALELYREHPELFDGLVLLSTRAEADGEEAKAKRLATAQRLVDPAQHLEVDESVRGLVAERTWQSAPALVGELREIVRSARNPSVVATLRAIAGRRDQLPVLPKVRVPTLAIWGEEDRLIPPERTRALAEGIPGAKGVGVPGAGHLVPMEAPDRLREALREFLAGPA